MKGWCVLQTKVRSESKVEEQLKTDYRVFCPHVLIDKRVSQSDGTEPLFPGYVFINMHANSDWHKPIKTPGVLKFVKFGDSPAILEDVVIDDLWCQEYEQYTKGPIDYQNGDRVRIKTGAMKLLEGVVFKTQGQRIDVLMDLLGSESKVTLGYDDVEPV